MSPTAPESALLASGESRQAVTAPPLVLRPPPDLKLIRKVLWLYIALWVFEGALRKWIFPGLASSLLIVRDPVLILLYGMALAKGIFPRTAFIGWIVVMGLLAFVVSVVATPAPILVEIYGLRAGYLHLPLVFLIAAIFNRDDIVEVGKWTLILAAPMAVLVFLQFRSSPTAFVNHGAGGEGSLMIESAYGHIRPSGTFSFTNGLGGFTGIVGAFFLYNLLEKRVYPRLLWLGTIPSLVVLIVLSGSRGAVGLIVVILFSVALISLLQPRYVGASLKLAAIGTSTFLLLGSFAVFKQGMQVFGARFGDSANVRVGFVDRFFGSLLAPFALYGHLEIGGVGLGMGTSVAVGLMLGGRRGFLLSEGELGRVLIESGPVIGTAYLLLRVSIVAYLAFAAIQSVRRGAHTLPLLLLSTCAIEMMTGQFGQPTALGFATIACGLTLAATRPGPSEAREIPTEKWKPTPPPARLAIAGTARAAHGERPVDMGRPAHGERAAGSERPADVDRPADGAPMLASELRTQRKTEPPARPAPPTGPTPTGPLRRGRSAYAERLHALADPPPETTQDPPPDPPVNPATEPPVNPAKDQS